MLAKFYNNDQERYIDQSITQVSYYKTEQAYIEDHINEDPINADQAKIDELRKDWRHMLLVTHTAWANGWQLKRGLDITDIEQLPK